MKKKQFILYMTALLLLLYPAQARADSGDSFRLDSSGVVTLDSYHAAKEGISSMSFSLTVEPEDGAKVEFVFEGSGAKILEYRYHADQKKLNIYMAGTSPLFAEGTESLTVGRVVVSDGNGQSGKAKVGVEPDSLKYVYGTSLKGMEGVGIPESVRIGGADTPPPVEELPVETPPVENPPVETPPAQTPAPPANTSAPGQPPAAPPQNTPAPAASDVPAAVPRPVGTSRPGGSQTADASKPTATPTASPGADESKPAETPSESPSPMPDDSADEPFETPSADSESGEETKSGGGFLEEVRLVLAGFAIAATVAGTGAVAVWALIKRPKGK